MCVPHWRNPPNNPQIKDIREAAQIFQRDPAGLLPPSYPYKLHDRDSQLKTIAGAIVANFYGRTSSANAGHGNLLIPGGFCFGKSRLGYEAQFIDATVLHRVPAFTSMPKREQTKLLKALERPIYIYFDLSDNGVKMSLPLDEQIPSVRLGLRLASRGWLGIPSSKIMAEGKKITILDALYFLGWLVVVELWLPLK